MKNKTFYTSFLLFLAAIFTGIFILSLVTLRDILGQVKEQCLNEQYVISSAFYHDMTALDSRGIEIGSDTEALLQPYFYLARNRKANVTLYYEGQLLCTTGEEIQYKEMPKQNPGEERTVMLQQKGQQYVCSVWGALPSPFSDYLILYELDISDRIGGWKVRNHMMAVIGGGISLVLAFLLLLLLQRLFRPLSQITQLSQKIADGDYRVRLPEGGKHEIAQMARSFNHMAVEIENKVTELATAAENRQRFVDNFAHELRTPLTAIYGYAEYLQKAAVSEEDICFSLNAILMESQHLQRMANQLMELSHLRSGSIEMKQFDTSELLEAVKRTMLQKITEKKILFLVESEVKTMVGDMMLLQNLLVNIIDNAIKASEQGGEIRLSLFWQDETPVMTVADDGKGMEAQELERITEPYYRVDPSRNRKEGGAGLGLAICLQIAEIHGGSLSFQSHKGQGTTVTIKFTNS